MDILKEFYLYLEDIECLNYKTVRDYRVSLGNIMKKLYPQKEIVEAKDITNLKVTTIVRDCFKKLNEEGMTESNLKLHLASLKKLYNFLIAEGYTQTNTATLIPAIVCKNNKRRESTDLTENMVIRIKKTLDNEVIEKDSFVAKRNRVLVMLLLTCGLRKAEAQYLYVKDIDLKKKILYIKRNHEDDGVKFGKERSCVLVDSIIGFLEEYIQLRNDMNTKNEFLFITEDGNKMASSTIQKAWKTILDKSNVPDNVNLHKTRARFATKITNSTENVAMASKLVGHSNISTTIDNYYKEDKELERRVLNEIF